MWRTINSFKQAHRQTQFFILMSAIYLIALAWTTVQAYGRLVYDRSNLQSPMIIQAPIADQK